MEYKYQNDCRTSHFSCMVALSIMLICSISIRAQKTPLNFDDYNHWMNLGSYAISNNGEELLYEIHPLTFGNHQLVRYSQSKSDTLNRARLIEIGPESDYMAFKINPPYDTLSQLRIDDVPRSKWPKDTLGILPFNADTMYKFPEYDQVIIPEEEGSWLAFTTSHWVEEESEDGPKGWFKRLFQKKKKQEKKAETKRKGKHLVAVQPSTGSYFHFEHVTAFELDNYGNALGFFMDYSNDTLDSVAFCTFYFEDQRIDTLFKSVGSIGNLTVDETGEQWAFNLSKDTTDVKRYTAHLINSVGTLTAIDSSIVGFPKDQTSSEHSSMRFSENGKRLYVPFQETPVVQPNDSIPQNELSNLDVWSYRDLDLQPRQLEEKKRRKAKTYLAVYHINAGKVVPLENDSLDALRLQKKGDGDYALIENSVPYRISYSWDYPWKSDIYRININSGESDLLLRGHGVNITLSPDGDLFAWYNPQKDHWYCKNLTTDSVKLLTGKLRANGVQLYNVNRETPSDAYAYGTAGWTQNGELLLYTKTDVFLIDAVGSGPPQNLTSGFGKKNTTFRLVTLDRDKEYVKVDSTLFFEGQNFHTNASGFYIRESNGSCQTLVEGDAAYFRLQKAEGANRFLYRKSTFELYPDLHTTDLSTHNRVTDFQHQRESKWWGTAKKYYWDTQGKQQKGLLFLPENFDSTLTYPVIFYFYEKNFNTEHRFRSFRPSPSTISIPFYTSNGYVVMVPDIHYTTGQPGEDALYAVSAAADALSKESFVDTANMAIQGQSWGGYQVAYMVTQTNRFAAAMAGAPVSNMTSAYGGIRWGSGLSRMFQYERTQSRIGASLWNAWDRYVANSPLRFLPNVETPLLIMHNDNDGAVPWYQGIELFVGLRRLNKRAWMLNYNGDSHNLYNTANRIDLSKRMFGFFNHYLKGAPMPQWMEDGIPAYKKGVEWRYEPMNSNDEK